MAHCTVCAIGVDDEIGSSVLSTSLSEVSLSIYIFDNGLFTPEDRGVTCFFVCMFNGVRFVIFLCVWLFGGVCFDEFCGVCLFDNSVLFGVPGSVCV